jgi:hypothetical protein
MEDIPAVVRQFWEGIDTHDWDKVAAAISPDFVRIGMKDTEADTCRGKDDYLRFVRGVIGRFEHHRLESRSGFVTDDGRRVFHEAIETVQPPGSEPITMRFLNMMELGADGLICKLDIFWKTPPTMPPDWIEVDTILTTDGLTTDGPDT